MGGIIIIQPTPVISSQAGNDGLSGLDRSLEP